MFAQERAFYILILVFLFFSMFHQDSPLHKITASGAVLIAWIIFTSLYFLLSVTYPFVVGKTQSAAIQQAQVQGYNTAVSQAMQTFSGNVFQNGYGKAVLDLATALDAQVKGGCAEAVPVQIGTGVLAVVNVECIQKALSGATAPVTK
jgi:hypothetical protein